MCEKFKKYLKYNPIDGSVSPNDLFISLFQRSLPIKYDTSQNSMNRFL